MAGVTEWAECDFASDLALRQMPCPDSALPDSRARDGLPDQGRPIAYAPTSNTA